MSWVDYFQVPFNAFHGLATFEEYDKWIKEKCPTGFKNFCGLNENFTTSKNFDFTAYYREQKYGGFNSVFPYDIYRIDNGDLSLHKYLNQKEVQDALHVKNQEWSVCRLVVNNN